MNNITLKSSKNDSIIIKILLDPIIIKEDIDRVSERERERKRERDRKGGR